jgi:hypothetical protein
MRHYGRGQHRRNGNRPRCSMCKRILHGKPHLWGTTRLCAICYKTHTKNYIKVSSVIRKHSPPAPRVAPTERRRGFWARLFGV